MSGDGHDDLHERLNEQGKTLSSIDTNLGLLRVELLGNGQPGRIAKVESKVDDLEAHKNRALGWIAAFGSLVGILLGIFEYLKHAK